MSRSTLGENQEGGAEEEQWIETGTGAKRGEGSLVAFATVLKGYKGIIDFGKGLLCLVATS